MSNHLAIAAVTAVLGELLSEAVDAAVAGAEVLHNRPDQNDPADANVNLYAYGVRRNPDLATLDLPTRRSDGTLITRPCLALDVHYLVTFYGDDALLEPQRLLGATTAALHAHPVLDPAFIRAALATVTAPDGTAYLSGSDLADQVERVRISPLAVDLEQMSKLWSVFFQTAYSLSVAYQASVVFVEALDEVPIRALPVTRRGISAVPFGRPNLERVAPATGPRAPITVGDVLVLTGTGLAAEEVRVRVDGALATPDTVTPTELRVPLSAFPADVLRVGAATAQVVHPVAGLAFGFESNARAFLLQPTLALPAAPADQPTASRIRLDLAPDVQPGQRVTLFLDATPHHFAFPADPPAAAGSRVEVPIVDVPPGTYLARVSVDGADSPLQTDATGVPTGPTVTVPA